MLPKKLNRRTTAEKKVIAGGLCLYHSTFKTHGYALYVEQCLKKDSLKFLTQPFKNEWTNYIQRPVLE